MMRAAQLVARLGLIAAAACAADDGGSRAAGRSPPEGEFVACPDARPERALARLRCGLPGVHPVCAMRNEVVCVRAPCPQPWYDRCSAAFACSDEKVVGTIVGRCLEGSGAAAY